MDGPVTDVVGNLLFCVDGSVWAVWRVLPHQSARSTGRQLRELYDRTVTLMKSLRGEVMIASQCEQVQPHAIVQRCLAGVDLDTNPHWAETVHNAWDQLDTLDVLGRSYWIAKPLSGHGWNDSVQALIRAAAAALGEQLGMPARPATDSAVAAARERARVAEQELGGALPLRAATEAELLWWLCRAPVRGVNEPQLERTAAVHNSGLSLRRGSGRAQLAMARSCVFDEGGRTDELSDRRGWGPLAIVSRRFLKCVTPSDDGAVASYQAYLVLAEMPRAFTFPGHEILARLAEIGFGVDYVLRVTAHANEDARAANRRRTRDLMGQDEEHAGDAAGVPADVVSAQEEIQHKNARLGASSTEVDLEVGIVACVWGTTARDADARAKALRQAFLGGEYRWERPLGGQRQLYQAMLPGSRTPMVVRECSQNLLASDCAMLLPVSATDFGDPAGAMFGLTLDGGAVAPFLLDPTYGPAHDSSGGIAVIGELGAGKSVILKNVAAIVRLMLDGRVIVIDRTRSREWVPVAAALPGDSQIVDVIDPTLDRTNDARLRHSCDPLRVFRSVSKSSTGIAETFFASWLDLESNSAERDALGRGLDTVSGTTKASSNLLVDTLRRHGKTDPAARALADRLERLRRDPITRPIFDGDLEPVDLFGADMVVFCTNEIPLPSALEMSNERMAARIPPRKLFGRAFHLLIAAIAKEICFTPGRWGEFVCDEAYNVTGTPEGQQIALEFVRDGRKHGADAAFGSHAPSDLGDDVLRGLIAVRFLGRQRDNGLARNGLAWLGVDPTDARYHEVVTRDLSPLNPAGGEDERRARAGEFLVRDHASRVGKVKVVTQPYRTLPEAVLTTPTIVRGGG
ncbi:ATP-binding protein [Amycolatopsis sp. NPDC048633]|uniref:ATP-binding protein n=1 Tax=Amycolatopsis sp. NPDC048633 TaxID=3157095 RepID=UPI0033C179C0